MLCIWVKDWESAAQFQYFLDMVEWNEPGCLPKWRHFCQDHRNLPNNAIHWREPSTVWKAWPMIGFTSETDFLEKHAQHPPEEGGFRNFPPMWSFLPSTINNNTKNITFGMVLTNIDEQQTENDAIQAQSQILYFKASTVMQSMRVIASRTLLPSSDVQGGPRDRTYCPSTFHYAYSYDTPSKYCDILARHGGRPMLAHECVLSIPCQMSNKNAKHPYCAKSHAPSRVATGLLTPFIEYCQLKADRVVHDRD